MHKDTRRLTVALEHLRSAYEEITTALGLRERSMEEQAVRRALSHMELVTQRLELARTEHGLTDLADEVEHAYASARWAWQGIHTVLNEWPANYRELLDTIRNNILDAINVLDTVEKEAPREAMHP